MQFDLDSAVNHLPYNRHEEQLSIQRFGKLLRPAIKKYLEQPLKLQLPSWARIVSFEKNLQLELLKAGSKRI